jgi:RimJ/RimL family protein N-acetyltransferase
VHEPAALAVRPAEPEDALEVLRWRNDEHVRSMSRNSDPIDEAGHVAWFSRALADPARMLLMGVSEGSPVGLVRFDRQQEALWEVSIVVAPEARGRGLGGRLLDLAVRRFAVGHPGVRLLAEVKRCNEASRRLFASLGFVLDAEHGELLRFFLIPPSKNPAAPSAGEANIARSS